MLLLEMTPPELDILELTDDQGMSVRVTERMIGDGCSDSEDLPEVIEDFEDEE